jgi:hypothetical protein
MALPIIIKSLDEIAEPLREHYVEKDGKFMLDATPSNGLAIEDVTGLKNSLAAARGERDKLNEQIRGFKDIDPTKARDALKKVEEMQNWDPDKQVEEKIKAKLEQMKSLHQQELEKVSGESKALTGQLEKLMVDAAASEALQKEGGNIKILMPHIRSQVRMRRTEDGQMIAEVVDESGNPRVGDAQGNPMTIPQLVDELRQSDDYAPAFSGSGSSGSGSKPSNSHQKPPTGNGGGVLQIKSSDQDSINENWQKIASGEAEVVPD